MKYLCVAALFLLVSCTLAKPPEKKNPVVEPAITHKMAPAFQESKKINDSEVVATLIQTALKDPGNTEPLYSLGYLHMQHGLSTKNPQELELAETYFKEVLTQFPGNQIVLQAIYNIYYDNTLRNRDPSAFEKAKAIFIQLPDSLHSQINPPSLARFGAMAVQQELDHYTDHQALRDMLLQAIHESPETDTPYIQLARLYREDRYFALAIATLKLGVGNNPESADLYRTLGDTYTSRSEVAGCNYEHPNDIHNAGKYYQLAVPLKPDDQGLHFALSQAFFDQNFNQLGLNEAQIANTIKPSRESVSLNAQNFSNLGYHQKALELLTQAVAQGYSDKDAGYHEIYMNKGDWKNAAAGFEAYSKSREKYSVYDLMKSDIIAQHAQVQSWLADKKIMLSNEWEKALFNYWNNSLSAEGLRKRANTRCEKTEYYFYTGYRDLQAGDRKQADKKFTAAIDQDTYRFIERPLARYFSHNN